MDRLLRSLVAVTCIAAFGGIALRAAPDAGAAQPALHPLANATLAPALKAVAERDHIVIDSRDTANAVPAVDDAVVFWVGTTRGDRSQQWLLQLSRAAATPRELAAHRGADKTMYLSWGSVVSFHSEVEALDLWVAGPVDMKADPTGKGGRTTEPTVRRTRVFVPRDYLRLGLNNSRGVCAFISKRVAEIAKADPKFTGGHLYSLEVPIKPESVALAKPIAERIGFTPEMERAWMGGYVALQAFYECASHVDELHDIADIAVEKPAAWKMAKLITGTKFMTSFGGGVAIDPAALGLFPARTDSFQIPYSFSFAHDPITEGAMIVTAPTPPLDVCAGIIALMAVNPHDASRVVEMILISASHGPAPKDPASGK